MKMNSKQYNLLLDFINRLEAVHTKEKMQQYRNTIKYTHNQFVSFCWATYYAIDRPNRRLIRGDLNDAHIETALKLALADYKEVQ